MGQKYHARLVNASELIKKAHQNKYAVGHFNINNLEWTKALLEAAQATKTPIILGASEGAIKYMGGYNLVVAMVNALLDSLDITVPAALHLDHGQSVESCKMAIDAGFSSVMYDGSHHPFAENLKNTKEVVAYAKINAVSVEAEIGTIGGEEDGVVGAGEIGDPKEAAEMVATGINFLAAGIGNIHGPYPTGWPGLNFQALEDIQAAAKIGMVLHGGSGIPQEQVKKAISLGISKINVNTELQIAFAVATRKYIEEGKDKPENGKGFDPRKLLRPGYEAIKTTFDELTSWFGCKGKA
ncbi:class II fructose-1,6-bisphosphate aldolase [Spiroplasma citri]|uniref:Class II fructose-1,6-bisphosphate aldolase n=1 Tax=Spiroplasma citri TaxID=2133 RepID=Q14QK9_SPICI|nr:class II fructose-1,6-bisphosphate aldolase [Spiroplasma citri]APE75767.1 fructose-bisphosphate aldolase [Spiroplasma citri]QED25513.1 class II fructose-1,6-bisphosphate aldolase [Spiroplasma citri]QIA67914.1 class II fructose-1,6-bisphosphate aldolase [Spiroplasma citri]QIA69771.1 class II fructose-1,6-bisphosphate aldolase [Spiroplasma citri]QIA71643.1 class II fructose-1,6-bisphosphate aldolase [Spiroplasma citri]